MSISILSIIFLVIIAVKVKYGIEEGFSKGLYRIVLSIISVFVVLLIFNGYTNWKKDEILGIVSDVVLLLILLVGFKIINLPMSSLKLLAKTPGFKMIDKVAGGFFAVAESILWIWIGFIIIEYFNFAQITTWVIEQANMNEITKLLYNNNYIKELILELMKI